MNRTKLIIAGLIMLAAAGCNDKIEPGTATVERPTVSGVATMKIDFETVPLIYEATATVTSEVESFISSRIMGPVTTIHVKEGEKVKAGQLLISIDSKDINSKVAAADAAYREALQALNAAEQHKMLAEATYSRFKNLYDEKALSLQEFDKIETQKKVAAIEYIRLQEMVGRSKAGLTEARVYLGFTKIVSPIDGIVTGKFVDPGSMAMPGMRLLTIEDTSRYRLEADIAESLADKISAGLDVEVEISALKTRVQGKISDIIPAVDPHSRTFKVFITLLPEKNLQSGLFARVKIPVGSQKLILVPAETLVTKGQLTGVYTVSANNLITYRLVRTGKQFDTRMEILSGLNPGDTVITDNISAIVDGSMLQTEN